SRESSPPVFGKRPTDGERKTPGEGAPPPAPKGGAPIATRPQRREPAAAPQALAKGSGDDRRKSAADRLAGAHAAQAVAAGPKATSGFEQARAAQGGDTAHAVQG